jgi:hypothetical protein
MGAMTAPLRSVKIILLCRPQGDRQKRSVFSYTQYTDPCTLLLQPITPSMKTMMNRATVSIRPTTMM